MKIKFCYIENFGTISRKEFEFQENLKVICEDNGRGKSTLAVFIKAMLFGLNKTTKKDLDDNERLKYKPWQGGNYGGYMDFLAKGRLYRVERYFNDKEGDKVRLIDLESGKDSEDYDKNNLGVELFGIDEAGYEKSTYFSQRDAKYFSHGKVHSKLTDLLEEENDMGSYEQAANLLDDAEKVYNLRNKQDVISKIKTAIAEAEINVNTAQKYEALLTQKTLQKQEVTEKLNKIAAEKNKLKADLDTAIKRAAYDKYIEYQESYKDALLKHKDAEETFLGKIPTDEELENISQKINSITYLQDGLAQTKADAEKVAKECNLIAEGKTSNQEELNKLKVFFNNNPPTSEQLDSAIKLYQDSDTLKSELSTPCPTYKVAYKDILLRNKNSLITAILGTLILLCGIIIEVFANPLIGKIIYIAGSIVLGGGALAIIYKYLKDKNAYVKSYEDNLNLIAKQYNLSVKGVNDFLSKYNLPLDNPLTSLMKIKESLYSLEQLSASAERDADFLANRLHNLTAKIKDTESTILAFYTEIINYLTDRGEKDTDNLSEAYRSLRSRFNKYKTLAAITAAAKKSLDECPKPEEDFANIDAKYDINALREEDQRLNDELDTKRKELLVIETDITKFNDIAAQKEDYQNEFANKKEELKKQIYYKEILQKTKKYLEKAKTSLTNKYLNPIKESFIKYLSVVTGKTTELIVNEDFQYEIYEAGAARDNRHFSSGYRDLFDICARLSLTDALYKDEKPFLILDDPFKNLDDGKMYAAKNLLDTLSKEYQVIYLVCHTSRKLEYKAT